jgi:hypothetical protein
MNLLNAAVPGTISVLMVRSASLFLLAWKIETSGQVRDSWLSTAAPAAAASGHALSDRSLAGLTPRVVFTYLPIKWTRCP